MQSNTYRKQGRSNSWASHHKHMRPAAKRAAHKVGRRTSTDDCLGGPEVCDCSDCLLEGSQRAAHERRMEV